MHVRNVPHVTVIVALFQIFVRVCRAVGMFQRCLPMMTSEDI